MGGRYTTELDEPPDITSILKKANINGYGKQKEIFCEKRGFHRINHIPKNEMMICYDCDLHFNDENVEEHELKYIIEPK